MSAIRIRWTALECQQVFEKMRELPEEHRMYMWPKAQMVLPPERRRHLVSSTMSKLNKEYAQWIQSRKKPTPVKEEEKPAEVKEELPMVITIEKEVQVKPDYGRISTSTLISVLLERLCHLQQLLDASELYQRLASKNLEMEKEYKDRLNPFPQNGTEERKDKPIRVAFVGPLKEQFIEIERRVSGKLPKNMELRFYDKDKQPSMSPVDHVIYTKWAGHVWWEHARSNAPKGRVHFVDGGIEKCVQKLFDICSIQ